MASTAPDLDLTATAQSTGARRIILDGRVQGVGFRPFVYRLATEYGLAGWVFNRLGQVEIHVEGDERALREFEHDLTERAPQLARPRISASGPCHRESPDGFSIRSSSRAGAAEIHLPPDLFTCNDCLAELNDPADRRYRYPFINCTQCGPRYTLIRGLPYDRPDTTMAGFRLCTQCRREYENPADRRFHAEPVACPVCGPQLEFHVPGHTQLRGTAAALAAIKALRAGQLVAVKGIGGYHLVCDARNDHAIGELRKRKPRPHKPLAVLFPAPPGKPLSCVTRAVFLARDQADLLLSPGRPIVLARRRPDCPLSNLVAPGLDEIGVMLPYSPLHHLLLNDYGAPVIATSANISGEPVLTENAVVEERLGHVADAFLHHDRPIERPADDPVYRVIGNKPRLLRAGRGNAPLEIDLPFSLSKPVIAVGGHMKNTAALAWQNRLVVSPHIGDMGTARSLAVFEQTLRDLQSLYEVAATAIVCDAHPGYATTRWAERSGLPVHRVLHHHAHAAVTCLPDLAADKRLVFAWDGTGYGADGTLWGGEALLGRAGNWQRFASLRPFQLPGGERAGREPWRSAAAVCWETGTGWPDLPDTAGLLRHAWERRINSPQTSAAGRLFDAAAALTGICLVASHEGQGPMELEAACHTAGSPVALPLGKSGSGVWLSDWEPLLPMLLDNGRPAAERAACFHASMAATMLQQARQARTDYGITRIGLSGGVFQNRILTERAVELLTADGFRVDLPDDVPVNDAGISVGQIIEYAALHRSPDAA
ncbi:MAG: carbamoyltransferase HypF [Gammaproteobacteria bacterium]|nr:MAG: carbamoyltransferase HypF [Gammaproteobacteria bacterium]